MRLLASSLLFWLLLSTHILIRLSLCGGRVSMLSTTPMVMDNAPIRTERPCCTDDPGSDSATKQRPYSWTCSGAPPMCSVGRCSIVPLVDGKPLRLDAVASPFSLVQLPPQSPTPKVFEPPLLIPGHLAPGLRLHRTFPFPF